MKQTEAFPTLLNKSDAMIYAADTLERMISNMRLLTLFSEVFQRSDAPIKESAEMKETLAEMKTAMTGIIDADLQERAMREAAKEIRSMAQETKLVEARTANADFNFTTRA